MRFYARTRAQTYNPPSLLEEKQARVNQSSSAVNYMHIYIQRLSVTRDALSALCRTEEGRGAGVEREGDGMQWPAQWPPLPGEDSEKIPCPMLSVTKKKKMPSIQMGCG